VKLIDQKYTLKRPHKDMIKRGKCMHILEVDPITGAVNLKDEL
jgi:hypothetical protein